MNSQSTSMIHISTKILLSRCKESLTYTQSKRDKSNFKRVNTYIEYCKKPKFFGLIKGYALTNSQAIQALDKIDSECRYGLAQWRSSYGYVNDQIANRLIKACEDSSDGMIYVSTDDNEALLSN